ncbi:uncharacterized protein LOC141695849 [Apium graveolens]|uniref:uncharacterized protein LOC141695849 n=1 Tax=Apium graveolens TaxID=4045 RepID=UPI003D7A36D6
MGNNITSTHKSPPATGKVILSDGTVFEYEPPLTVAELMLEYPQQVVVDYKATTTGKRPSPLPADEKLDTHKVYIMLPVKKGRPVSLSTSESKQLLFRANNVLKSSKYFSSRSGFLPFFVKICPAPGNWVAENKNGIVVKRKEELEGNELPEKEDYFGKMLEDRPELLSRQVSCKGWKPSLDTIVEKGINPKIRHWLY